MLKKLIAALAVVLLGAGLVVATGAAANAATVTAGPTDGQCVVSTIHHPAVAEVSHQEYRWIKTVPGSAAVTHAEWRFQTRTVTYGYVEHKYIYSTWTFTDGGTTRVNGHTVSGHWVDGQPLAWRAIPDSVINAVWGAGGIPDNVLGGSEAHPAGNVPLSTYGASTSKSVPYYASKEQNPTGYTAWGPWSGWTTTNPGAATATMNVDSRTVTDKAAVPASTVYYLTSSTTSTTLTAANWTKDRPASPWTEVDERKVVDTAAVAAWDEKVYGTCPTDACLSQSATWSNEAGDAAPTQDVDGLRFAGPQTAPVDYLHAVSGNLMGVIGSSYTIAAASGYHAALVYELNPQADLGHGVIHFATVSIEPYMNGWAPGQTGTFTVTATTKVWTSKVDNPGLGSQANPATIAQLSALMPENELIAQGLHLGSNSTAGQFTVVSAVGGCGDVAFGAYDGPHYTEPQCDSAQPGVAGQGIVTIPSNQAGASYQVKTGSGGFQAVDQGDTVKVPAGTTVTVAVSGDGHPLSEFPPHTFTTQAATDCNVKATVSTEPVFTLAQCVQGQPGQSTTASYELTAVTGVSYEISTNGTDWTSQAAGSYPVTGAAHIYVRAIPGTGFTISGADHWDQVFPDLGDSCLGVAAPADPRFTDAVCDLTTGTAGTAGYEIVAGTHVSYEVSTDQGQTWSPVTVGAHPATPGSSVWVQAVADQDYKLTTAALTKHDFPRVGTCQLQTDPLVTPTVDVTPPTCAAPGSYTLGNDLGIPTAIVWTVNGSTVAAGPYTLPAGTTARIHAAASSTAFGITTQQDWTVSFAAPTGCDLKTLALTGLASPAPWVTAGGMLLLVGGVLTAVHLMRRRRSGAHRA